MADESLRAEPPPVTPASAPAAPPPGYVWIHQPRPPAPPDPPWHAPRWLKIATVGWIAVLVVGGALYARYGRPSVREQTTIGSARPTVDRAVVEVVRGAGDGPVVAVSGFDRVESCRLTAARSGADYQRVADIFTSPGTESTLLGRIAAGLPAAYQAEADPGTAPTLYADAGDFVSISGTVPTPGEVEIRVATGCRDPAGAPGAAPVAAPGDPTGDSVRAALDRLGAPATPVTTVAVFACGDGTTLRSARAVTTSADVPGTLAEALAPLSAAPVANTPHVYAYRTGQVDVVVRNTGAGLTVTATTRCRPDPSGPGFSRRVPGPRRR